MLHGSRRHECWRGRFGNRALSHNRLDRRSGRFVPARRRPNAGRLVSAAITHGLLLDRRRVLPADRPFVLIGAVELWTFGQSTAAIDPRTQYDQQGPDEPGNIPECGYGSACRLCIKLARQWNRTS